MADTSPEPYADWVGRRTESNVSLDPAQATRMAATLGQTTTYVTGDPLPPGWHWLYFPETVPSQSLGLDGHPVPGVTMPPVALPRRMWAGGRLAFDSEVALGTTVRRVSTITAVTPKLGRSGALCFVTLEHDLSSGERSVLRETQDVVYRELRSDARSRTRTPPGAPDQTVLWQLNQIALFRYSALTFNAHRIHYDVDYARDVEGYPGLVVHGPLLATLLMGLAVQEGRRLSAFEYLARSPAFLPEPLTTNLREDPGPVAATQLWVAGPDGRVVMEGTATYRERVDS